MEGRSEGLGCDHERTSTNFLLRLLPHEGHCGGNLNSLREVRRQEVALKLNVSDAAIPIFVSVNLLGLEYSLVLTELKSPSHCREEEFH